jgi:hypothetical protein
MDLLLSWHSCTAFSALFGIFQGYNFFHHIGLDRNMRDAFKGHAHSGDPNRDGPLKKDRREPS